MSDQKLLKHHLESCPFLNSWVISYSSLNGHLIRSAVQTACCSLSLEQEEVQPYQITWRHDEGLEGGWLWGLINNELHQLPLEQLSVGLSSLVRSLNIPISLKGNHDGLQLKLKWFNFFIGFLSLGPICQGQAGGQSFCRFSFQWPKTLSCTTTLLICASLTRKKKNVGNVLLPSSALCYFFNF